MRCSPVGIRLATKNRPRRARKRPLIPNKHRRAALRTLAISQIRANPYQPRKEFRPEELADLEASLRTNGLLQPITVRPAPNGTGFELIAGERRFRAATRLGWTEIPAIVRETDDRTLLTLAMVENLQRADLDPIEEADGYHRLMEEFAALAAGSRRRRGQGPLDRRECAAAAPTARGRAAIAAGEAAVCRPCPRAPAAGRGARHHRSRA